jgi:dTDP-4-amino-4,6-dideoxygalactose transaminase
MKVRLVDLAAQNAEIREEVEAEFIELHRETAYVGGARVEAFEQDFARFLGVSQVLSVASGTDALRLALLAAGVGPGDEVITVPMTFIATVEAIVQVGARPVFVDVDPMTCNMSPAALVRYLERRKFRSPHGPRAILPVHLYGMPAAMAEINEIAACFRLAVVEDACQAHGARLKFGNRWAAAGTLGDAGCFSFYPGKNLGGWGEGGAVATNNEELARRVRSLRDHGRLSHYLHEECGYNARLDALQAVVLRAKLKRLGRWNARRRELAAAYHELLTPCGIEIQSEAPGTSSCWHLFAMRSEQRDTVRNALLMNQIECGIHYPVPLHLQPACRTLGYRSGDFPVAERIADTVLSLPMHPHLTNLDVVRVAEVVGEALNAMPALTPLTGTHTQRAAAAQD